MKFRDVALLLLLTASAFFIHGYHPYVEDAAFYVPTVEKALLPSLFPHDAAFFQSHASLTFFPDLVAGAVRLSHLPLETVLLILHLTCLFVLLLGCWKVMCACFESPEARWGGVALLAALLTLPAGATSLLLMDQYLNPRSFSSCAGVFAVLLALQRRYPAAFLLLAATALIHPLMPVYTGFLLLVMWWGQRRRNWTAIAALAPLGVSLDPPTPAYHQAALLHPWHYVQHWAWYDWLGLAAPVAFLLWLGRFSRARKMANVELLSTSLLVLLGCSLAGALVLDLPARFEAVARLQPMRSLHLTYILAFLLAGGVLGEFVLRRHLWRWLLLFVPICAASAAVQLMAYPASAHVEWPGARSRNDWVQAFLWIRDNTPQDAYFALNPGYLDLPGEDWQAFRPLAERSMLADRLKDSGAVTMFPKLAEKWWEQVEAQKRWGEFQAGDFHRLQQSYGVDWLVLEQPGVPGLSCPYQNQKVLVCRVP